jgi:hypothetical protein
VGRSYTKVKLRPVGVILKIGKDVISAFAFNCIHLGFQPGCMSLLKDFFSSKDLLAIADKTKSKEPRFSGYGRRFKVIHPSNYYPNGGIAFFDTADAETIVRISLTWKEAIGESLKSSKC